MTKHTSLPDAPLGDYTVGKKSHEANSASQANQLGTDTYVDGLVDFITRSATPLTIALQGEWGSGKTSLMYLLEQKLCDESKTEYFLPIRVNTWEMAILNTPEGTVVNILAYLLEEMLPKSWRQKAGNALLTVGKTVFKVGTKVVAGQVAGASDLPETLMNGNGEASCTTTISELRQKLDEGIDERLDKQKAQGFIVFIDDLDRLKPKQAVEILEILKNIFTLRRCIFVLAIDYGVVVKGLEEKFGPKTNKNEREFRSFFDKLIQVPFSMPITAYHSANIVLEGLTAIDFLTHDEAKIAEQNLHKAPFVKRLLDITHYTVGKNPRSIKRLLNSLSLTLCINKQREDDTAQRNKDADRLLNFALIGMQVSYPSIYLLLTKQSDFTKWTIPLAIKNGVLTEEDIKKDVEKEAKDWRGVLAQVCDVTPYQKQHEDDIARLLDIVREEATKMIADENNLGQVIQTYLDRSLTTAVGADTRHTPQEVDWQEVSTQIRDNIQQTLEQELLQGYEIEVPSCTAKKVVFSIYVPSIDEERKADITYSIENGNYVATLHVDTLKNAPNTNVKPKEAIKLPPFNTAIPRFDEAIEKARTGSRYFEGQTLKEALAYRLQDNKWAFGSQLIPDMTYTFSYPDPATLYSKPICQAMAQIIAAAIALVDA